MSLTLLMKSFKPAFGSASSDAPGIMRSHLVFQTDRPINRRSALLMNELKLNCGLSVVATGPILARKLENCRMSPKVPLLSVTLSTIGRQLGSLKLALVAGYGKG